MNLFRSFAALSGLTGLLMFGIICADAEEYQWYFPVNGATYPDVPYARTVQAQAFLWIPPSCTQVRAVVIAQNNMEEPAILAHPAFRQTLADLGIAELFVNRVLGSIHFRYDLGEDRLLERLLKNCAEISGYREIATVPLVPLGHSAMAEFPWDIAMWNPQRTLAALSISGQWPFFKDQTPDNPNGSPAWGSRNIDGVPGLITKGEYEVGGNLLQGWYASLQGDYRRRYPNTALTQVVEPGCGHFEVSDEKVALIANFLRKAAGYRLPKVASLDEPVLLRPISPANGWLYDSWRLNQKPTAPAARHSEYKGNRNESYFAFDEEMARTIEIFQSRYRNQIAPVLSFTTPQGVVPHRGDHIDCHLPFEPLDDGVTLPITGVFADKYPWEKGTFAERPVKRNDPIPFPAGEENRIITKVICGSAIPANPGTVTVCLDRTTMKVDSSQPLGASLWLDYPGNAGFKRMTQQGEFKFWPNGKGEAQHISFPQIPDQNVSRLHPIQLMAQSSAHLPVRYFVRSGPAEVDTKGQLTFTGIPPRSRYPLAVTVVAWQLGHVRSPEVQAAPLAEQTFLINR